MRAIAFSDGHIGEYGEGSTDPKTGLNTRLLDTLRVWDWVLDLAISEKADAVIFGGDRFKPHKPPAWMRDLADEKLSKYPKQGMRVACLLGNHDMYDKAGKWHSYNGVQVWNDDIVIFDKPGALDFNGLLLHFLPYGYSTVENLDAQSVNILFFHDSIVGHSRDGNFIARTGIPRENLDREEFSLILGGHIHQRQELAFHHAPAFHIGTPLERIQDGEQGPKGAFILDIDSDITCRFVESPLPKIITVTKQWNGDLEEICALEAPEGNVILLLIEHTGTLTASIRKEAEKKLRALGAVSAKVRLQSKIAAPMNITAQVDKKIPIGDQICSYVKQIDNDPNLLAHLEQIRQRGDSR